MTDQIDSVINNLKGTAVRLSLLMALAILLSGSEVLAAPPQTMPIWRARVYFQTFNTPDAGSDDSVRVELGSGNSKETTYTLRLTFLPGEDETALINTNVALMAAAGKISPLSATTYFRLDSVAISSEGTIIKH